MDNRPPVNKNFWEKEKIKAMLYRANKKKNQSLAEKNYSA